MSAFYFRYGFSVENYSLVLGYVFVGEMNHNVFLFQLVLQSLYVNTATEVLLRIARQAASAAA